MPVRQLDHFHSGDVGLQPSDVSLPGLFFRAGVEEDGMLDVAFRGGLSRQKNSIAAV